MRISDWSSDVCSSDLPDLPHQGERVSICASGQMRVQTGADEPVALLAQADDHDGSHCAGFWPQHDGWHVLQSDGGEWPFYVYQRDALPALRTWRDRSATLRLATFPATSHANDAITASHASPFPYALAWLLSLTLLWLFERARAGDRKSTRLNSSH